MGDFDFVPEVLKDKKIYLGLGIAFVASIILYNLLKDPSPSSPSPHPQHTTHHDYDCGASPPPDNPTGEIRNNICTPQMKKTCYPCEPIPELAGDPSSPQAHHNPQCGVNRLTGEFGTCKPATSWNSPNDLSWDKCSSPPDNQTIPNNQCYNCSADSDSDPNILKLFQESDYDVNFFCESSCGEGNDFENPDNFEIGDNLSEEDNWYGFPIQTYSHTLKGYSPSSTSPYLDDIGSIVGPFQFNSNIDEILNISNDFVAAHNNDIRNDNVYWFSDPSSDQEFTYMYTKSSPLTKNVVSTQMCTKPSSILSLEQGLGSNFNDTCDTINDEYFPDSGYLTYNNNNNIGITSNIDFYDLNPENSSIISYKDDSNSYVVGPSPNHPNFEKDDHISVNSVEPGYYYDTFQELVDDSFKFECRNLQLKPKNEELFREIDNNRYYHLGELDDSSNTNINVNLEDLNINLHIDKETNPSLENPHPLEFRNIGLDITNNYSLSDIFDNDVTDDKLSGINTNNILEKTDPDIPNPDSYKCKLGDQRLIWKNHECSSPGDDFDINNCKPYATNEGVVLPFKCTNQCLYSPELIDENRYVFNSGRTEDELISFLNQQKDLTVSLDDQNIIIGGNNADTTNNFVTCSPPYQLDPNTDKEILASCKGDYITLQGCYIPTCGDVYNEQLTSYAISNKNVMDPADFVLLSSSSESPATDPTNCYTISSSQPCSSIISGKKYLPSLIDISDTNKIYEVLIGKKDGLYDQSGNTIFTTSKDKPISQKMISDNTQNTNFIYQQCLNFNGDKKLEEIPNFCDPVKSRYKVIENSNSNLSTVLSESESIQKIQNYIGLIRRPSTYCELKTCGEYFEGRNPTLSDLPLPINDDDDDDDDTLFSKCSPSVNFTYKTDFTDLGIDGSGTTDYVSITDTTITGNEITPTDLNGYINNPTGFITESIQNILNESDCDSGKLKIKVDTDKHQFYLYGCSGESCTISRDSGSYDKINSHTSNHLETYFGTGITSINPNDHETLNCSLDEDLSNGGRYKQNYINPIEFHDILKETNVNLLSKFESTGDHRSSPPLSSDTVNVECVGGIAQFSGCNNFYSEYRDSDGEPYYSVELYSDQYSLKDLFSLNSANGYLKTDSQDLNWASCINFIPEINLENNHQDDPDITLHSMIENIHEHKTYPWQMSRESFEENKTEYPSIGAVCTNENNSVFSFGNLTADSDGNVTVSNKVCKDGFVPYGELFNNDTYLKTHYDLSPCKDLDESSCNFRIDCEFSDSSCSSINNSGCVNITTPGLNIPGSIRGYKYIKSINNDTLFVNSEDCQDDSINHELLDELLDQNFNSPESAPNIYKNDKISSLMHCNNDDIVRHTDPLTGVINVLDPENPDTELLPKLKFLESNSDEYGQGDIRFRLNLDYHENLIKDSIDYEKTIGQLRYESLCPFGTILQMNEPDGMMPSQVDFNSKKYYNYSCLPCPSLDPNSTDYDNVKTVCGFNYSSIDDQNILQYVNVLKNGEDFDEYKLLKQKYRLIPDDEGNICKDGYYYKYIPDENGHDVGGSCEPKKCNVIGGDQGDYSDEYDSPDVDNYYDSITSQSNTDDNAKVLKWWGNDRYKGLTGIVSSSPNIINDETGEIFGITPDPEDDKIPSWRYGSEDVLTIYPEYSRLNFEITNDNKADGEGQYQYIIEGFENNIGYNNDEYFSSSAENNKYCSGNLNALRDTCHAATSGNFVSLKTFTRLQGDEIKQIYNASSQELNYPIKNPCIHHIDPTSYYPDEESCLYENLDKFNEKTQGEHGYVAVDADEMATIAPLIGSNAWIPLDHDNSSIGNIDTIMNEDDMSMFSNIYDTDNYKGLDPDNLPNSDDPSNLTNEIRGICVRNKKLLYEDFFSFLNEKAGIYPNMNLSDKISNGDNTFHLLPKKIQDFFKLYSKGDKYYHPDASDWGPCKNGDFNSHNIEKINPKDSFIKGIFLRRVTNRYTNELLNQSSSNGQEIISGLLQYFSDNDNQNENINNYTLSPGNYNKYVRMIWIKSFIKEFEKFYEQVIFIQDKLYSASVIATTAPHALSSEDWIDNYYIYPRYQEGNSYINCDPDTDVAASSPCIQLSGNDDSDFNNEQQLNIINLAKGFEYWQRQGTFYNKDNLRSDDKNQTATLPQNTLSIDSSTIDSSTISGFQEDGGQDGGPSRENISIVGNFDDSNTENWLENIDSCGWTMKINTSDDKIDKYRNRYARQCNRLKWRYIDTFGPDSEGSINDNIYPRERITDISGDPYSQYNNQNNQNPLPINANEFISGEFNSNLVPPNFYRINDQDNNINVNENVPMNDNINYCISNWDDDNKVLTCNYLPMTINNFESNSADGDSHWYDKYIQNIKQPFMGFLKNQEDGDPLYNISESPSSDLQPYFGNTQDQDDIGNFESDAQQRVISDQLVLKKDTDYDLMTIMPFNNANIVPSFDSIEFGGLQGIHGIPTLDYDYILDSMKSQREVNKSSNIESEWDLVCGRGPIEMKYTVDGGDPFGETAPLLNSDIFFELDEDAKCRAFQINQETQDKERITFEFCPTTTDTRNKLVGVPTVLRNALSDKPTSTTPGTTVSRSSMIINPETDQILKNNQFKFNSRNMGRDDNGVENNSQGFVIYEGIGNNTPVSTTEQGGIKNQCRGKCDTATQYFSESTGTCLNKLSNYKKCNHGYECLNNCYSSFNLCGSVACADPSTSTAHKVASFLPVVGTFVTGDDIANNSLSWMKEFSFAENGICGSTSTCSGTAINFFTQVAANNHGDPVLGTIDTIQTNLNVDDVTGIDDIGVNSEGLPHGLSGIGDINSCTSSLI